MSIIRVGPERPAREGCSAHDGSPPGRASETGVPAAVLADIGGGALTAFHGRRAVVIGETARCRAGAVIVEVADLIGKVPGVIAVVMMPVMTGVGHTGSGGHRGKNRRGGEKLQSGHCRSPGPAGRF